MSATVVNMHSIVAQKLISLLDLVTKRYVRLMGGSMWVASSPITPMTALVTPISHIDVSVIAQQLYIHGYIYGQDLIAIEFYSDLARTRLRGLQSV